MNQIWHHEKIVNIDIIVDPVERNEKNLRQKKKM